MEKKNCKERKPRTILFVGIVAIIILIAAVSVIKNKTNFEYGNLDDIDKAMLSEINAYCQANETNPIWPNYDLHKKTIFAIKGRLGEGYIINPQKEIKGAFVKKIDMPEDFSIEVYRIAAVEPKLIRYRVNGNFNIFEKTYKLFGNEIYFTRYDESSINGGPCDSKHYITFLSHEAFHYYTQREWDVAGRFNTDSLTERDLDLLEEEYEVLEDIQYELNNMDNPERNRLLNLAQKYVEIVEKRKAEAPDYVNEELNAETSEGTATYVGIKASQIVGYDFGIMRFAEDGTNAVCIPFDVIIPVIKEGKMSTSTIASQWVYETGALLCMLLDELDVPMWKERLNAQTMSEPITLYSLLSEYVSQLA